MNAGHASRDRGLPHLVRLSPLGLDGLLRLPASASGVVAFAHGSGSSRLSPRNNQVADGLAAAGIGSLLFDLLTDAESADRRNVFDIGLLASRLLHAVDWLQRDPRTAGLSIGLFGASTGAAAALVAAADPVAPIVAVVSRGGRPDLAGAALGQVRVPTLLIVGSLDIDVLALNRWALKQMRCERTLQVVVGASHLFTEPGALESVTHLGSEWFRRHMPGSSRRARTIAQRR